MQDSAPGHEETEYKETSDLEMGRSDDFEEEEKRRSSECTSSSSASDTNVASSSPRGMVGQAASKHNEDGPPPDGGLRAWLQVVSGFMLYFNSWYGSYQRVHCLTSTNVDIQGAW